MNRTGHELCRFEETETVLKCSQFCEMCCVVWTAGALKTHSSRHPAITEAHAKGAEKGKRRKFAYSDVCGRTVYTESCALWPLWRK